MALPTAEAVGRPMEILLIEDSLVDARFAILALRKSAVQHRMTLLRDGQEATQFLLREGIFGRAPRPDVILLDLNLPIRDGFQLLQDIKSSPELCDIPVVIMTATESHRDALRAQLSDADWFLTKPVNLPKFLELVQQLRTHWRHDVILPVEVC